jgi:hypothetical protein
VPYPYPNSATVSPDNLRWLEHSLLFFYKTPRDFGARLSNGLYYQMQITEQGIVGTPQAIDLVQMGAPPADPSQDRGFLLPAIFCACLGNAGGQESYAEVKITH